MKHTNKKVSVACVLRNLVCQACYWIHVFKTTDMHLQYIAGLCDCIVFLPSLKVCKPAYSEPLPKPRNMDGCGNIKTPRGAWFGLVSLSCVAAAGQLAVVQ